MTPPSRLFREAPQLKSVAAAAFVVAIVVRHAETQVYAISTVDPGRPAVTVVPGARQHPQTPIVARVAEARGGSSELVLDAGEMRMFCPSERRESEYVLYL